MAGRRGVEEDVVEAVGLLRVGDQPRELVERGDLDGAVAGQLLLDRVQLVGGKHAAIWPDHALAISRRRRLRVNIHHLQAATPERESGLIRQEFEHIGRLDAGSVLTSSTRLPASASASATAQATWSCPLRPCR